MANIADLIKVLDNMTNVDVEDFRFSKDDHVYDLNALDYPYYCTDSVKVDGKAVDVDSIALFGLDVLSCRVSIRRFAYRLKGVDGDKLSKMVSAYWYYIQLCNVNQVKNLLDVCRATVADDLNDEHMTRFNVLDKRINNAAAICNRAKAAVVGVEDCAKNIVRAYLTMSVDAYGDTIKDCAGDVLKAIDGMFTANSAENADNGLLQMRCKQTLKAAIADLKVKLFPVGGCVEGVHHKCAATMFEKVYMCAYKRTKPDKHGLMRIQWSKRSEIVADIILQVVDVMQRQQIKVDAEKVVKD